MTVAAAWTFSSNKAEVKPSKPNSWFAGDQIVPPSRKRRRLEDEGFLQDYSIGYPTDYQNGDANHYQVQILICF